MAKGLPEYSDEQLMQMLQEFQALSEEEKAARRIGAGVDKITYDIPGKDLVLKTNNPDSSYRNNSLQSDYIYSKQLNKSIPVETPILIKNPNSEDFLIQKKLKSLNDPDSPSDEFYKSLYDKYPDEVSRKLALKEERKRIDSLPDNISYSKYLEDFDNAGLEEGDIHRKNIGIDRTGKAKAFDVSKFWFGDYAPEGVDVRAKNEALYKMRNTFSDKIDALTKPRIYRSIPLIGPAIGAGLAAMSGEANAASAMPILGEADSLGPEQGSEDYEIENPQRNPAARRAALESLLKK